MKIFNILRKSKIIHIVDKDFNYIKHNVKIKYLPRVGDKIYFDEEVVYNIIDVIHYVNHHQTIWIVVQKQNEENMVNATLNISL